MLDWVVDADFNKVDSLAEITKQKFNLNPEEI